MKVQLFLVPYDSGHENLRLGHGPGRLLQRGLVEALQGGGHDVAVAWIRAHDGFRTEIKTTFDLCRRVSEGVRAARREGRFPVVVSGNCNVAVGTLSGLSEADPGAVWFDAHGEYNAPETTSSGYLDGMGLAMACGLCWQALLKAVPGFRATGPDTILHIGGRDFDPLEEQRMRASGVHVLGPDERSPGLSAAMDSLRSRVKCVYLHFDLDALDPVEGRANELAAPGGLLLRRAEEALLLARERLDVAAFGLAGYDPRFDDGGRVARAALRLSSCLLGGGPMPGRERR